MITKNDFIEWVKYNPGCRPSPFSLNHKEKILAEWYSKNIKEAEDSVEDLIIGYNGIIRSGYLEYIDDDILDNPCRGCMPKTLQKITEDCVGCGKK
jgi:hypothetical protein